MNERNDYLSLIKKATEAADAYYNTDVELMTDAEYDAIIDRIQAYQEQHGWNEGNALIEQVAAGKGNAGDVQHDVKMLSLAKANEQETIVAFVKTVAKGIVLEPKLDGLAVSVIYDNGKITRIATRGNGQIGEDITKNITSVVKGLPREISFKQRFEVRGEVFITEKDFITASKNRLAYKFNEFLRTSQVAKKPTIDELFDMAALNRTLDAHDRKAVKGTRAVKHDNSIATRLFRPEEAWFANSRNAVAGALRNEDAGYEVPLTFAAYDVLGNNFPGEYLSRVEFAALYGIQTAVSLVPSSVADLAKKDILAAITAFGTAREAGLEYPTDGVVLKANSIEERAALGEGSRSPKWAIAYKYPSNSRPTVVRAIELNIGRTGRLALRAKVDPVLVDGTEIKYATLHNVSWTQEKDVRIGDTVKIRRANDVIPYLDEVVLNLRPADAKRWVAPAVCPQCGSEWDKSTLLWRCPSISCGALNGIIFAGGRDYFDWEGLSEAIITRLNDEGLVNNIADVFDLTQEQLAKLDMGRLKKAKDGTMTDKVVLGETVAAKIYAQIQNSKKRPLSAVLAALGVRTLGRTFGRRLEAHYGSMKAILSASVADLTNVDGIAIKKAEIIHAGLREKLPVITALAEHGVTMSRAAKKNTASVFSGKKIVITGSIPGYTRGAAQELITEIGATASSSVSSNTDYLVADEESKGSSKYKKAQSLGVNIISPVDFLKLAGK